MFAWLSAQSNEILYAWRSERKSGGICGKGAEWTMHNGRERVFQSPVAVLVDGTIPTNSDASFRVNIIYNMWCPTILYGFILPRFLCACCSGFVFLSRPSIIIIFQCTHIKGGISVCVLFSALERPHMYLYCCRSTLQK